MSHARTDISSTSCDESSRRLEAAGKLEKKRLRSGNQSVVIKGGDIPGSCHGSQVCKSISTRVPFKTSSFVIFL